MDELIKIFDIKGLSKSPAIFDIVKLTWMNGEYIKKMDADKFYEAALPYLKESVKSPVDLKMLAGFIQSRIGTFNDIAEMVDFVDTLPEYSPELYIHKKMKTTLENSLVSLEKAVPFLKEQTEWTNDALYENLVALAKEMEIKNGQILWPIRTALSGKPTSPCGATELCVLLGKDETIRRLEKGIELLS